MKDYIEKAIRTESPVTQDLQERLGNHARKVHAFFGLLTETGELADALKRHIFYGKDLDLTNINEEVGDVLWYLAILMHDVGIDFEKCMNANIRKLAKRYPEKYSHDSALNRDLEAERKVLTEKYPEKDCWEIGRELETVPDYDLTGWVFGPTIYDKGGLTRVSGVCPFGVRVEGVCYWRDCSSKDVSKESSIRAYANAEYEARKSIHSVVQKMEKEKRQAEQNKGLVEERKELEGEDSLSKISLDGWVFGPVRCDEDHIAHVPATGPNGQKVEGLCRVGYDIRASYSRAYRDAEHQAREMILAGMRKEISEFADVIEGLAKRPDVKLAMEKRQAEERKEFENPRCPKCDSPDPKLHPAMQYEGEVQECEDLFHKQDKKESDRTNFAMANVPAIPHKCEHKHSKRRIVVRNNRSSFRWICKDCGFDLGSASGPDLAEAVPEEPTGLNSDFNGKVHRAYGPWLEELEARVTALENEQRSPIGIPIA